MIALLAATGWNANKAQTESYNLYVAGTQATSTNASNITESGITGTVSYDNNTKTLTLNDVKITPAKGTPVILVIVIIINLVAKNQHRNSQID